MASQKIGSYAFLAGVIIAVIIGIILAVMPDLINADIAGIVALVLVILGLIVGFLNIKDKHVTDFLIATIAVAAVGNITAGGFMSMAGISVIGSLIGNIVSQIVLVVAPAALVVGLKQIMALAKEQVM
jgi:hypothetical protein